MLRQHVVGLAVEGLDVEEVDEVVEWAQIATLEMTMDSPGAMVVLVVVEVKMVMLIGLKRGNVRRVSHSVVAVVVDMRAVVAMVTTNLELIPNGPHVGRTSAGAALVVAMR